MKKAYQRGALGALSLMLAWSAVASQPVAELRLLAGGALAEPLDELAVRYEKSTGHKLVIRYGTTPQLIELATSGTPFDLGVFPREVLQDAAARARFAPAPPTDVARSGLAVAVRSGAPKPDISTPDALKKTLLNAKSIATIPASATGAQLLRVFDQLGIAEAMKPKLKPQLTPAQIVATVASGENELAVFLMNVVMAPGLDVVGPFPAPVQQEVVFTAAVAAVTGQADAARAFIRYLNSPEAVVVLKAKGLDRGRMAGEQ